MARAPRRSPHNGLTASEIEELIEASRTPERLQLEPIDRYRELQREYADRCVIALTSNDLMGALRAATLSRAAGSTVQGEIEYEQRAREQRARWEAEGGIAKAARRGRTLTIAQ